MSENMSEKDLVSAVAGASVQLTQSEPLVVGKKKFLRDSPKLRADRSSAVVSFKRPVPQLDSVPNRRSREKQITWKPLNERLGQDGLGTDGEWVEKNRSVQIGADGKILKLSSRKALNSKMELEMDILNSYWGWRGILQPEYEVLEGYTLLDVEAYYKQAITRMLSLAFRAGVHVVGEDDKYIDYIKERMAQIGYVMGRGFPMFLKEILKNLWICSNCFVAKVRDEKASGGGKSERNGNMVPVAGYSIIPPHTVFPYLDGHGHIEKWRRFYKDGRPYRDYLPEDIIHFKWDVKPGHIFGCPRVFSVRDDIFALRRLEENVELLLVNHLFPLFHVKVGNEKAPVEYLPDGSSEIDWIRAQIQMMSKEGVFVTDDRVEVTVKGAEGKGIDPAPMLQHYKNRVFAGLGVSSVDLGEADTANRATAENVSQNLKDMITSDVQTFGDMVEMEMFREWYMESPVALSVQKAVAGTHLDFGEIDIDGQIKQETHNLNAFQSHAIDQDELRRRFRRNPFKKEQEAKTHFQLHQVGLEKAKSKLKLQEIDRQAELTAAEADKQRKHQAKLAEKSEGTKLAVGAVSASKSKTTIKKSNSKTGSSHTVTKEEPTTHTKKALSNIVQPANQHGKNLDPHSARSAEDPTIVRTEVDEDFFQELHDQLVEAWSQATGASWPDAASEVIDRTNLEPVMAGVLKQTLALMTDEDLIWTTLRAYLETKAA